MRLYQKDNRASHWVNRMLAAALMNLIMLISVPMLMPADGWCDSPISDASQECLACHVTATPTIVEDWKKSRHAATTPSQGMSKQALESRVSATKVPEDLLNVVVGCAECHTLNTSQHKDVFVHNEKKTHLTVTPRDCSTCHPTEAEQYEKNLMAFAHTNLAGNKLYGQLMTAINGTVRFDGQKTSITPPNEKTESESCFSCHGTKLEIKGLKKRDTDYGEMEFVEMSGYPNQGVGRINPDGSRGSCSSCHSRHQFSIKLARQPYTCSQCHKGPDVPAYKIYSVSKHGNIFSSMSKEWNLDTVPWTAGKDFTSPTCATCHVSLVVDSEGKVISKRTHQMSDRLPWRLLGLIYAHAHPKSPDTSIIQGKDGLPLPTTLDGKPLSEFLISSDEQKTRKIAMQGICRTCHSEGWVNGHWERLENTIKTSNEMTLTSTEMLSKAWKEKLANPDNIFDEGIEKQWIEQWLFFANSTRLASAMMGTDYGVFENGRWAMTKNIQDMLDRINFLRSVQKKEK